MPITDYQVDGALSLEAIARTLMSTRQEVASTAGVSLDAVSQPEQSRTPEEQRQLREMVEIIDSITHRFGTPVLAYAWYRSSPLIGYGGSTPMELVQEGHADWVREYLASVDAGIFA